MSYVSGSYPYASGSNPYPLPDVLLVQSNLPDTSFACKFCGFTVISSTFYDPRTGDTFVICSSDQSIWRVVDWLEVDWHRVGNWDKGYLETDFNPEATTNDPSNFYW